MKIDEIVLEAKKRYPYGESDNESKINKLSSKRRRFIEGAIFALEQTNKELEDFKHVLEYIHKNKLVYTHGTARILHQKIGFLIGAEFPDHDKID